MPTAVRPDEAMGLLYPQQALDPARTRAVPAAPDPGAGVDLAAAVTLFARLGASLDDVTAELARQRRRNQLAWEDCYPIDLFPLSASGAGSLTDERWQPRQGVAWQILLVTITFGAGATFANMYKSADASGAIAGNALKDFVPNATSSVATWEPKGLLFLPGQQALFNATGGGITVRGEAVEIAINK